MKTPGCVAARRIWFMWSKHSNEHAGKVYGILIEAPGGCLPRNKIPNWKARSECLKAARTTH